MRHFRLFSTQRLSMRELRITDQDGFFDMMRNPNVMLPIPQQPKTREESDAMLEMLIERPEEKTVWAVTEQGSDEFIGIAGLLINDEGHDEIGYRLREKYWGIGYGTEMAKGLIALSFTELNIDLITADVFVENDKSIRILDKFMHPVREFYNPSDQCNDRRYHLLKKDCNFDLNGVVQVSQNH